MAAYNQVYAARKYGAGLKSVAEGQVESNRASAGASIAQSTQAGTDPATVASTEGALAGHPRVAGSAAGPISGYGDDQGMNAAAQRNAATNSRAREDQAQSKGDSAANANLRAALTAGTSRIAEIDRNMTEVVNNQIPGSKFQGPRVPKMLDQWQAERAQLIQQTEAIKRQLSGDQSKPPQADANNYSPAALISKYWQAK